MKFLRLLCYISVFAALSAAIIFAQDQPGQSKPRAGRAGSGAQSLPNSSQEITPTAPAGARFESLNPGLADSPDYAAGQAVTSVTSPDHNTLLVLTSGYNLLNAASGANQGNQVAADSAEFIFARSAVVGSAVATGRRPIVQ